MMYFEKDYILRLIHGIAQFLARMLFGCDPGDIERTGILEEAREDSDLLRRLVDGGKINAAEEHLFGLLENAAWSSRQKAALAIAFYEHVNSMDDAFLARAGFPREEILSGLKDAMYLIGLELPEGFFPL